MPRLTKGLSKIGQAHITDEPRDGRAGLSDESIIAAVRVQGQKNTKA
jgi:hypothetical protein